MSLANLKRIGAYVLVLIGVATLVVLSALSFRPSRAGAASRSSLASESPSLAASSLSSSSTCAVVPASSASTDSLREAQVQARALLDHGYTNEALTRLRSIAAADGALPGINLDLSTAFLKLHQTEQAKSAINAQLSASECASRLSPEALDAYCRTRLSQLSTTECRQELASIERSAHFQSALVQMELANALGGGNGPALDTADPGLAARPEHKAARKLMAAAPRQERPARPKAAQPRPDGRNVLAAGAGTDAALGAYSK